MYQDVSGVLVEIWEEALDLGSWTLVGWVVRKALWKMVDSRERERESARERERERERERQRRREREREKEKEKEKKIERKREAARERERERDGWMMGGIFLGHATLNPAQTIAHAGFLL